MKRFFFLLYILIASMLGPTVIMAQSNNEAQAKKMMLEAYDKVFGNQGCFLRYDAHLSFFFHSEGWACLKKQKYSYDDKKTCGWCDGKNFYYVDRKKKEIQILNGHSTTNGSTMDKFTFHPADYHYSWKYSDEGIEIMVKAKKNVKGVRTAKVFLDKRTRKPLGVNVRIAFLWAKVRITTFKEGGINDSAFVFPRQKFKGYKMVDKRK
jgi:hypothetical protein